MSDNKEDKIKEFEWRLQKFQEIFESFAHEKKISQSNNDAAGKINSILFEKAFINENDLLEIKRLINWTERQLHWDGVSWMDYKLHVRAYLGFKGFKIDLPGI
ncbi:MAG: hypothetical protein NVV82_12040 [Sporocytophaga sp.]|nr:hypothetical protein [Sporocytophaga sp.]